MSHSSISLRPLILPALVAALGGLLFGYDTAVINGANTFLQSHFHLNEKRDAVLIGLATASALIGCVPGAMFSGYFSDRFGRRKVLFFCAILFAVSGIFSAIPQTFTQFIGARVLAGVAVGIASMICPVYIAEMAPPKWRGCLGTLFQMGIVTGIFVSLFINLLLKSPDHDWNISAGWRWMLATEIAPAFLFLILLFPVAESPHWLIQVGREEEARKTLSRIGGEAYATEEVASVRKELGAETGLLRELFARKYAIPTLIAFVLMAGSQLSGINVIMYYSTNIFRKASDEGRVAVQVEAFQSKIKEAKEVVEAGDKEREPWKILPEALRALTSEELKPVLAEAPGSAKVVDILKATETLKTHAEIAAAATKIEAAVKEDSALSERLTHFADVGNTKAFMASVWISLVNLLATLIAIFFVDKAGRKPLLLIGNAIQVAALATVGYIFHTNPTSPLLLVGVLFYVGAFAMAMGPLPWVVCSEIFPAKLRGKAMSFSTFVIWMAALIVSQTFPQFVAALGSSLTFGFYAVCSAATFLLVLLLLPETKGRTLEEISASWSKGETKQA